MADYPDWTDLIHIVGTDIMVAVDVQGAYIMMPVDIQAQYVNLDIDIVAQSIGNINIDLVAQSIGNIVIDIEAQSVGIYLRPEWACLQGEDKNFSAEAELDSNESFKAIDYTVPEGKTLYIVSITFALQTNVGGIFAHINAAGNTVCRIGGYNGGGMVFSAPYVVEEDEVLEGHLTNVLGTTETLGMTIRGYEI